MFLYTHQKWDRYWGIPVSLFPQRSVLQGYIRLPIHNKLTEKETIMYVMKL